MEQIFSKKEPWLLMHVIHRLSEAKEQRTDLIPEMNHLQLSVLNLNAGKTFKAHKHILKPHCTIDNRAQETWIVVRGKVKCILYDVDNSILAERILQDGDCSITLVGGHNYECLSDNSIIYEAKSGPYEGQEKDKVFI